MSRWLPNRVVCNSDASRQIHVTLGYAADKMAVIPNGFDLTAFQGNSAAREAVRKELKIPNGAPVIGLVGRFHPQKGHDTFVQAARVVHQEQQDAYFVLCGFDVTWNNPQLAQWIMTAGLTQCCRLLGRRDDIPRIMASLDIAVSSSSGEAFANVIGEAMSCSVPCVVTDVGDSALIVGQTGRVVPSQNPRALAAAVRELIELGTESRERMGTAARERIQRYFSLPTIVRQYEGLYQEMAEVPSK
jgi:glycosyltransferase involved in cell wall biosynthesis